MKFVLIFLLMVVGSYGFAGNYTDDCLSSAASYLDPDGGSFTRISEGTVVFSSVATTSHTIMSGGKSVEIDGNRMSCRTTAPTGLDDFIRSTSQGLSGKAKSSFV